MIGGRLQGNEAEWLNEAGIMQGASGSTSGRSVFLDAPLRATSSGLDKAPRMPYVNCCQHVVLQFRLGSFCVSPETFTLWTGIGAHTGARGLPKRRLGFGPNASLTLDGVGNPSMSPVPERGFGGRFVPTIRTDSVPL